MPQAILNWVAVALSVAVFFAPVTTVLQVTGGSEIIDVEQEECSVEVVESVREERRYQDALSAHPTLRRRPNTAAKSTAQLRYRVTERSFHNGTGGWLRL